MSAIKTISARLKASTTVTAVRSVTAEEGKAVNEAFRAFGKRVAYKLRFDSTENGDFLTATVTDGSSLELTSSTLPALNKWARKYSGWTLSLDASGNKLRLSFETPGGGEAG